MFIDDKEHEISHWNHSVIPYNNIIEPDRNLSLALHKLAQTLPFSGVISQLQDFYDKTLAELRNMQQLQHPILIARSLRTQDQFDIQRKQIRLAIKNFKNNLNSTKQNMEKVIANHFVEIMDEYDRCVEAASSTSLPCGKVQRKNVQYTKSEANTGSKHRKVDLKVTLPSSSPIKESTDSKSNFSGKFSENNSYRSKSSFLVQN